MFDLSLARHLNVGHEPIAFENELLVFYLPF